MILNKVIQIPELFAIRRLDVSENGVGITFHPKLLSDQGDIRDDLVCILKLDEYHAYNTRTAHNPPKVIDNLVIVECCDGRISVYLIELRLSNGRRPTKRLHPSEIEEKFSTAIHDFIEKRYANVFSGDLIKEIKAYLVADPWKHSGKENANELFAKKMKSSALDAYSSRKPFRLFGHSILISPIVPPDPVITPC